MLLEGSHSTSLPSPVNAVAEAILPNSVPFSSR